MTRIKILLTTTGGTIAALLGGWDTLLIALLTIVAVDYFTGLLVATYNKKVNSYTSYRGLIKKVGYFALIAACVVIDNIISGNVLTRTYVITYLIVTEAISITENLAEIDVIIPKRVKDILQNYREGNKK